MLGSLAYIGIVGLSEAMYLWMVAAGLSLVFGVLRVINFAHGSLYMIGAYLTFSIVQSAGGNFWMTLLLTPILIAALGWFLERVFFRRIYSLPDEFQLLLTFAFVLIFDDLVKIMWGPIYQSVSPPDVLNGAMSVLGRPLPIYSLFVLFVGISTGVGLWVLFERTSWGSWVGAMAADREMASATGVNVPRVYTTVFAIGAGLAGLGGALAVPMRALSPGMGEQIIIEAFVVVVIGGLGSLRGAFIGAILIGLLHAFGVIYLPIFELALAYIAMAAVLTIRPWGLFGVKE